MKNILLLTPFLASLVASQSLLQYGTGELPTCAETCDTINTANSGCAPPASASQSIYLSCFCQSAFLTGLSTDASTICASTCTTQTERDQIQTWYNSICASGSAAASSAAAVSSVATVAVSSTATLGVAATTTTGISEATSTLESSQAGATNNNDQSSGSAWWDAHARWIAMAIVLIVGFTLIGVGGMFLKRRNTRKHQREAAMAPPVVWGPHQNQHYTGGTGYGNAPVSSMIEKGKGKGKAPALPTSNNQAVDYSEKDGQPKRNKSKSGKLRKFLMG